MKRKKATEADTGKAGQWFGDGENDARAKNKGAYGEIGLGQE